MFTWKRLENHKTGFKLVVKTFCKHLNHLKTFLMFTGKKNSLNYLFRLMKKYVHNTKCNEK